MDGGGSAPMVARLCTALGRLAGADSRGRFRQHHILRRRGSPVGRGASVHMLRRCCGDCSAADAVKATLAFASSHVENTERCATATHVRSSWGSGCAPSRFLVLRLPSAKSSLFLSLPRSLPLSLSLRCGLLEPQAFGMRRRCTRGTLLEVDALRHRRGWPRIMLCMRGRFDFTYTCDKFWACQRWLVVGRAV